MSVHVGSGKRLETYKLHKDLLQVRSEYFRAAFGGSFVESATNELSLPDDDPEGFRCFVDWLYTGKLTDNYDRAQLVRAWIVADKLMCPDMKNLIVDNMQPIAAAEDIPCLCFKIVADHDAENSKIMDCIMSFAAYACSHHWEEAQKFLEYFFSKFSAHVAYRMVAKVREYDLDKKAVPPEKVDTCEWHEHEQDFEGSCNPAPSKKRKRG